MRETFIRPMLITKQNLKEKLKGALPGIDSHLKMAPPQRAETLKNGLDQKENAKKSAVMMLFFVENEELQLIVIRRSDYVGIHAGQIAFPGGRYEEEDGDVEVNSFQGK